MEIVKSGFLLSFLLASITAFLFCHGFMQYGRTPLWIATVNSKAAIVKLLLQYKAHVDEQRYVS